MPHLPPIGINGGSVKMRIPIREAKDDYRKPLFNKREPVTEAYPPDSENQYVFERFSLADHDAQIYKIEIHGANGEVFEFRPKGGECSVEIYYALASELPLRHEDKWLEPGEKLYPEAHHHHK
jgi:hypothetical protein